MGFSRGNPQRRAAAQFSAAAAGLRAVLGLAGAAAGPSVLGLTNTSHQAVGPMEGIANSVRDGPSSCPISSMEHPSRHTSYVCFERSFETGPTIRQCKLPRRRSMIEYEAPPTGNPRVQRRRRRQEPGVSPFPLPSMRVRRVLERTDGVARGGARARGQGGKMLVSALRSSCPAGRTESGKRRPRSAWLRCCGVQCCAVLCSAVLRCPARPSTCYAGYVSDGGLSEHEGLSRSWGILAFALRRQGARWGGAS